MSAKRSLPPPSPTSSSDDGSDENVAAVDAGVEDEEVDSSSQETPKSTYKTKPPHNPSSKSKSNSARKSTAPTKSDGAKSTPKPAASEHSEEKKKKKKRKLAPSGGGDAEERRLGAVVPLWSEEDEVAILNGIKAYREEKGSDPSNDLAAFLEFLRGSLSAVVSKRQLGDKVRRLKKKYADEAAVNGNGGGFVKPRDLRLFDIAKEIWRGEDTNGSAIKRDKKQEEAVAEDAGISGSVRKSKRVEEKRAKKSDKGGSRGSKERKEIVLGGNEEVEKSKGRKEIVWGENEEEEGVSVKGDSDFESSYPNFHAALMDFLTGSGPVDGRNLVKQNLGLAEERARVLEPKLNAFYIEEMKMRAEKIRLSKLVADAGVEIAGKRNTYSRP